MQKKQQQRYTKSQRVQAASSMKVEYFVIQSKLTGVLFLFRLKGAPAGTPTKTDCDHAEPKIMQQGQDHLFRNMS